MIETRQLRYFVALAEELHFARAAARVGIEQPPLSKAISELERELNVRLFIRTRRSTQLTYVGETLLKDAKAILNHLNEAHRNLRAAASGSVGRLRIAICDGTAHPRLVRVIAETRRVDPHVDIHLVHCSVSLQLRQLHSDQIDVALSLVKSSDPDLRAVPLWAGRPRGHCFAFESPASAAAGGL
jgi:DNA-binding transcriptional LysR family regulator